jgi:prepilin-type processing-associated H-X9-DG protein
MGFGAGSEAPDSGPQQINRGSLENPRASAKYKLPNFAMFLGSDDVCRTSRSAGDCLGGQLRPDPRGATGKGWARANQQGTFENINFGRYLTVEGSFPFANSAHRGGSNFVFCDGAVRFVTDTIDGAVYAVLITPAGTRLPQHIQQAPFKSTINIGP